MHTLKWIVLALACLQGGWLVFDGSHALLVGDYITPATGPHAGQLGPWSGVVSAFGIEPRSTFIKCLLLILGLAWIGAVVFFAVRPVSGRSVIFGCAVGSLWYLPSGTFTGILVLALLLTTRSYGTK
jgi:hypothetical protein